MLVIMVRIGDHVTPGRKFEDSGVGQEALEKNAHHEFEDEVETAQYSANYLGQPIQLELLDTLTGEIKASRKVIPDRRLH